MGYNIDLHCHSFFSGDGVSSPESLIESARSAPNESLSKTHKVVYWPKT